MRPPSTVPSDSSCIGVPSVKAHRLICLDRLIDGVVRVPGADLEEYGFHILLEPGVEPQCLELGIVIRFQKELSMKAGSTAKMGSGPRPGPWRNNHSRICSRKTGISRRRTRPPWTAPMFWSEPSCNSRRYKLLAVIWFPPGSRFAWTAWATW